MNRIAYNKLKFLVVSFATLMVTGCSEEVSVQAQPENLPVEAGARVIEIDTATEQSIQSLLTKYMIQIDSDYSDVNASLVELSDAVNSLVETPDDASLNAARNSWLESLNKYELTALHRYFADVTLEENPALELFQLQYQINHWPILPGYLDYVVEYPESGIVNDMTVTLEVENLRAQHGAFDVNEAAIGFHVLEFLLWGENGIEGPRPVSDYFPQSQPNPQQLSDGIAVSELSNNRRRLFVSTVSNILIEDFESLMTVWSAGSTQLRLELADTDGAKLLLLTLDAMTALLTEELLVKSLYPMLNGDYEQSSPSPYSKTSQNVVSSHLSALEQLLIETRSEDERNLDEILTGFSTEYAEFFLQSFDASKECLVTLYSSEVQDGTDTEFKVVECINLLTNMIDYFEQLKFSLSASA